jgi:ribosomal-protein-alanine N-acetyltransferase
MDYKIISLDISYADEIHRIEAESFSSPWSKESIDSSLESPVVVYFGALEAEKKLCAFVCASVISPEAEILNIAVSKSHRRQGIAETLISYTEGYFRENSVDTVFLEVRETNTPAQSLYQKFGFDVIGKRKKYYTDPTEDAILMKKTIV